MHAHLVAVPGIHDQLAVWCETAEEEELVEESEICVEHLAVVDALDVASNAVDFVLAVSLQSCFLERAQPAVSVPGICYGYVGEVRGTVAAYFEYVFVSFPEFVFSNSDVLLMRHVCYVEDV